MAKLASLKHAEGRMNAEHLKAVTTIFLIVSAVANIVMLIIRGRK